MPEAAKQPLWGEPRQQGASREINLRIQPELLYLQGHFPDTPIVPGVALTDWAVQQSADFAQRAATVASLTRVKFHQVLRPDDEATLVLTPAADGTAMDFLYRSEGATHASGRIHWR
ncbi:MAG: ApeI family dehydratase [Oceanococcus sp.]